MGFGVDSASTNKYTQINKTYSPCEYPQRQPLAASQYLMSKSGRFVTKDGSGNVALSAASDSQIMGWTEYVCDQVNPTSSTAAAEDCAVIDDVNAVFELPIYGATLTAALLKTYTGKTCDLYVAGSTTTTVQKADVTASTYDVVKIVGGNVARQTLYVRLNPTKMFTAGVV